MRDMVSEQMSQQTSSTKKDTHLNGERHESARINSCPSLPQSAPALPCSPVTLLALSCNVVCTRLVAVCSTSLCGWGRPHGSSLLDPALVGDKSSNEALCAPLEISPSSTPGPPLFDLPTPGPPSRFRPAFSFPALPRCLLPPLCHAPPPRSAASSPSPCSGRDAGPQIARHICSSSAPQCNRMPLSGTSPRHRPSAISASEGKFSGSGRFLRCIEKICHACRRTPSR